MRSTRPPKLAPKLGRAIVHACIQGGVAILALLGTFQPNRANSAIAEIVPHGSATEVTVASPHQLDISGGQSSSDGRNLFHSFEQFDLPTGQTANFVTVPTIQNVLSHIQGPASSIDGLLQITGSNANLYLINPSGILFGPHAQLNLPGNLTATTATRVSFGDQIFSVTAGNLSGVSASQPIDYSAFFGNPTAFAFDTNSALVNLGHLAVSPGQNITLMGGTLLNTGSLSAPGGKLTLIAVADSNLVRIGAPNQLLSLEVSPTRPAIDASLQSAPQTLSEMLTGSGLDYADTLVVEVDGTVRLVHSGMALPNRDGDGQLIASGSLSVASPDGNGGDINLFGTQVGVMDASVSASGQTGGGILRIGGDYLGGAPGTPTAQQTYISAQSSLTADAIASGNGGQIYIWSDEATQFYGHLSAQGGSASGHGGFAEISGKQALNYRGTLNINAPQGATGNVLFDPFNIIIKDGSSGGLPLLSPFFYDQQLFADATFYEKDLEQLSNVTLLSIHDIIIEDLADGALSFVSPSNVTFQVDTNRMLGGRFMMQDTSDTIQTAGGNLQIISGGQFGDLFDSSITVGNLDTRAIGPASIDGSITLQSADGITARSLNAGTGNIQLLGNSIDLIGGNGSVTASNITLAPTSAPQDIRLGGAANDALVSALDLSSRDLAAIARSTGQINIGSATGSGNITFLSDLPDIAPVTLRGSENARLYGPNANTLWTITGLNSGTLSHSSDASASGVPSPVSFLGIGNLIGGNQNDTFNVAPSSPEQSPQITQSIQGGSGDLIFTGEDIDLAATVSGSGTLRLFSDLIATETLRIGGKDQPDQFNLSDRELNALQAGFESIQIGSDRSGPMIVSGNQPFYSPLSLRSGRTIDTTQGTLSTPNGAGLTLSANGSIATGNLITQGGNIQLTSATGALTTGSLSSASPTQGGDITLSSPSNITTGHITAASGSSSQTRGGDISLSAGETIRGIEPVVRNGTLTSIETTPGGRITLTTDGGIPFNIGAAIGSISAELINGTLGQITDQFTQLSSVELSRSLTAGNITIVTNAAEPAKAPIIAPILEERQGKVGDLSVVLNDPDDADTAEIFSQIETTASAQFEAYLSSSGGDPSAKVATLAQVQDTLKQVQQQKSQVRPALLYAYFVPSAAAPESPSSNSENKPERLPHPDDQLEVMLITAEGTPLRRRQWGITRAQVEATGLEFRQQMTSQFSRPNQYLPPAQQLHQWLIAPIEAELSAQSINNLALIMDDGLRTLPIAALHDGQQFLVEKYSLGLVPTFSLTNFGLEGRETEGGLEGRETEEILAARAAESLLEADQTSPAHQVLAMGASRFVNQPALPAVEAELSFISEELWLGKTFLNEDFTLENLQAQVASHQYNTLHLATHATFSPGDRESAYIQLWEQRLGLGDLEALNFDASNIELIILSACSTAMGDRNSEYGFAGFAVSAGSQSAMASLWPVNDEGTLGFMTQFYQQLPTAITRSEALRQAQIALLNGDIGISNGQLYDAHDNVLAVLPALEQSGSWNFSHPFYWSAFTMIGSPW